jgi:hypothetical protein
VPGIYESMNLIVVHKNSPDDGGESLLRFALDCELVAGVILDGLGGRSLCGRERASILRSSPVSFSTD